MTGDVNQAHIKKLEQLPTGWAETTVSEVVKMISTNGKKLPQKKYMEEAQHPVIDQGQDYIGGYHDDEELLIEGEPPFIVFGDHSRAFKFANFKFIAGADGVKVMQPIGIDPKWAFYIFQAIPLPNKGYARHFQYVKEAYLPVPPLAQQKRIVAKIEELFSHIDAGIAALNKSKQLLKQYRQSVLKAAVTGELTKQWRDENRDKLEPASELLERILKERREKWEAQQLAQFEAKGKMPKNDKWKEKYKAPATVDISNLPSIPEEWEWATLPQLGELNRGKSKHRPRNDPILYDGEYPFVQTGDVRAANGWLTSYGKTYSEAGLKQSRLWPKGTLCITIAANIADTAVLGIDACFPDSVVGFIPHDESINVELIEFYIRTVKGDLEKYAPATAQKNINLAILETVGLPLLPTEEQKALVDNVKNKLIMIQRLDAEIDSQLIRADRNKQSILSSAFSGNLVENNSTDSSASDLIQKIRQQSLLEKANKESSNPDKQEKKENKSVSRRSLISVLEVNKEGLSPDSLMQQAGFSLEEVDEFYQELSEIGDRLIEEKLKDPEKNNWPYDSFVKLKLKDK